MGPGGGIEGTAFCSSVTPVEMQTSRGRPAETTARSVEIIIIVTPLALEEVSIAPSTGLPCAVAISGFIVKMEVRETARVGGGRGFVLETAAEIAVMSLRARAGRVGGRKVRVASIGRSNSSAAPHAYALAREAVTGRYAGISYDRTGTQMGKSYRGKLIPQNVR